jgi:hypothetical protein
MIDNKNTLLAALARLAAATAFPADFQTSPGVGVTETQATIGKSGGFADTALLSRWKRYRQAPLETGLSPPNILDDPIVLCPQCDKRLVLPELRQMKVDFATAAGWRRSGNEQSRTFNGRGAGPGGEIGVACGDNRLV